MELASVIIAAVAATATLAAVWYARQTVAEGQLATAAAHETVTALGELLARARAAHDADERDRRLRKLLHIAELVEAAFWRASVELGYAQRQNWRCEEQTQLAQALAGADEGLPECERLVGETVANPVMSQAETARAEVKRAIEQIRATAR